MSARNYMSAGEKNPGKLFDSLPKINQQKFGYRCGRELPPLSANTNLVNRNINFTYNLQDFCFNSVERAGTPFSDFFSESETDTPDLHSEESDSSSGSALRRNTAEATKILSDEWERIERTLYGEEGEKCTRPQMLEECKQWRKLHPQLRIVGRAVQLPEKRLCYKQIEHDEVIAMHYSDYEEFSESEERLSESSTDVTPQNSPRISITEDLYEPKLFREKISFFQQYNDEAYLPDMFCSLLQITPIQIHSPLQRKKQNPTILRSEAASSKWMKTRPDSSVNCDRNSAKSFISLDTRNYNNFALSASERNTLLNTRVVTARQRDMTRLEPITPEVSHDMIKLLNGASHPYSVRKVSLPPLLLEEERKKVTPIGSAKKHNIKVRKSVSKNLFHLDKAKHN
ncbi:hypothetical protein K1T71_005755 [Dendrolimus kikuchii]|uniref:Uncharacterized protein n=1 Tax=Dendrolimus kikuchii TaxID=765133 RepID=A0ACC1D533_9NEOP|nr:hypothetical protein K1T71_005755 [Dendrolimus kikuchii]